VGCLPVSPELVRRPDDGDAAANVHDGIPVALAVIARFEAGGIEHAAHQLRFARRWTFDNIEAALEPESAHQSHVVRRHSLHEPINHGQDCRFVDRG